MARRSRKEQKIADWEQHNVPIICERPGYVKYEDLVEGISTQREVNKQTGQTELIVKQHRGELHPQIVIYADKECTELVGTYADSIRSLYLRAGRTARYCRYASGPLTTRCD